MQSSDSVLHNKLSRIFDVIQSDIGWVRKFTRTGLITGTDFYIPIASSVFSYFDTVYMYRLIPGPIYAGLSHPFLGMGPGPLELGKIASF